MCVCYVVQDQWSLQFRLWVFKIDFMVVVEGWPILMLCGAVGAIAKDVFKDNKVKLPTIKNGFVTLGFIGGAIIGAIVGYIVDNDPITAFLGGYSGGQIIEALVKSKTAVTETVETAEKKEV